MNINLHSSYSFAIIKYSIQSWFRFEWTCHLLFHNVCSLFFAVFISVRMDYTYPYGSIFVNNYHEIVSQVNFGIWTQIPFFFNILVHMTFWCCCDHIYKFKFTSKSYFSFRFGINWFVHLPIYDSREKKAQAFDMQKLVKCKHMLTPCTFNSQIQNRLTMKSFVNYAFVHPHI